MEMLRSKAREDAGDGTPLASAREFSVLPLTAEEGARLLRIISRASLISRHQDVYQWLADEVQHFLPHQILISAWGDFARGDLRFDLASGIRGVRTRELARCSIHHFVRECYELWVASGREPRLLKMADIGRSQARCTCALHAAFRNMRTAIVHGVRDKRSSQESVYIALGWGWVATRPDDARGLTLIHALIWQIDAAFRRVTPFPLETASQPGPNGSELSRRERQILAGIACGKTNVDIATSLEISPYTVKNHVQRIFRKIGVRNRTQAATQYQRALPAERP